jgi:ribosomal-protein-serine acetyltransferase
MEGGTGDAAPEWGFELQVDGSTTLRALLMSDADELFALTDSSREDLRKWLNWVDSNTKVEDSRAFISRSLRDQQAGEGIHTGIWHEGELVGVIDIFKIDSANASAEIGYWLGPAHRGRGIMTRACMALVSYAFGRAGLNRIEIRVVVGNSKSAAIPDRLGLTREGVLREAYWLYDGFKDVAVYSILAREWEVAPQGEQGE